VDNHVWNRNLRGDICVCCSDLLLVSLLSGSLTALDLRTGHVIWSIPTGQKLLSSSITTLEVRGGTACSEPFLKTLVQTSTQMPTFRPINGVPQGATGSRVRKNLYGEPTQLVFIILGKRILIPKSKML